MIVSIFKKKATGVVLEVEVPRSKEAEFCRTYQLRAGVAPDMNRVLNIQNKWGLECRVYFDAPHSIEADLDSSGITFERRSSGYGASRQYRINNNEFFWRLVAHGFRLGEN